MRDGFLPCFRKCDCPPARAYCCVLSLVCRLEVPHPRCQAELINTLTREEWEDMAQVERLCCPLCPMQALS